jgi:energy-coupling factor transport system substrate-specific component
VVELFTMWRSTRMVVLTAVSAALYASILIPFKVVPLIPGVTELRPASAVPVVCSFLFGPAGAWGAAFGNAIGELFGGLGPGDLFGFLGNLALGFVPYAMWDACTDAAPDARTPRNVAALIAVIAVASVLCATIVGWGLNLLGFHLFTVMASAVMVNSTLVSVPLAPLLLRVLYPRLAKAQLLYRDVLGPRPQPPRARRLLGVALIVVGTLMAFAAGWSVASGWWVPSWAPWHTDRGSVEIGVGVLPFLAIVVLGCALL